VSLAPSRKIDWRASELGEPKRAELSQGSIAYHESGEGPPVVFVHGFLSNANLWRKVVPALSKHFHCLAVDWPLGSHYLPAERDADLTPPGISAVIAEFLERLDLSDVILLGNDSGGAYSQMVAAQGNDRVGALVLNSCETPDARWPPRGFGHLKRSAQFPGGLTAVVQGLRLRRWWRSPIAYGLLTKRPIEERVMWSFLDPFFSSTEIRRDARKVIERVSPRFHRDAAETLIRGFEAPVLFAWASEDRVFPLDQAKRYAESMANSRLETIEDSYTYVSEDNPEQLVEALIHSLDRLGQR
jgi:pimeloyl-ACP methyl ester carboxylesterase